MIQAFRWTAVTGVFGVLLLSSTAEASYCEGQVFTPRDAAQKLTMLNALLVRKDEKQIKRLAGELEANLPCMKTPLLL